MFITFSEERLTRPIDAQIDRPQSGARLGQ